MVLHEYELDVVMDFVAFTRVEVVIRSNDGSVSCFSYSRDAGEVSNVPSFARFTNRRTVSRALHVVEEYAEPRVSFRAGSILMLATDAQPQFAEWCAEADGPGDNGGDENQGG